MQKRKIKLFVHDVTTDADAKLLEDEVNKFLDTHKMAEPPMMGISGTSNHVRNLNYVTVMCQYYDGEEK